MNGVVSFLEAMALLACAVGNTEWVILGARSEAVVVHATDAAGVAAEAADIAGGLAPGGRLRVIASGFLG